MSGAAPTRQVIATVEIVDGAEFGRPGRSAMLLGGEPVYFLPEEMTAELLVRAEELKERAEAAKEKPGRKSIAYTLNGAALQLLMKLYPKEVSPGTLARWVVASRLGRIEAKGQASAAESLAKGMRRLGFHKPWSREGVFPVTLADYEETEVGELVKQAIEFGEREQRRKAASRVLTTGKR